MGDVVDSEDNYEELQQDLVQLGSLTERPVSVLYVSDFIYYFSFVWQKLCTEINHCSRDVSLF